MANNYTQFSFAITLESDEEGDWAKRACRLIDCCEVGDITPEDLEAHPLRAVVPAEYEDFLGRSRRRRVVDPR